MISPGYYPCEICRTPSPASYFATKRGLDKHNAFIHVAPKKLGK